MTRRFLFLGIILIFVGACSFYLGETDDEECLPPNASSSSETQVLLTTEDQVPRYLTASPCKKEKKKKYFFQETESYTIVPTAVLSQKSPKDRWSTLKMRSKYYLPILQWLPLYNRQLLVGDFLAGITLACLLIPQALSYATALCKLDAIHGLYGIAFPAISYAVFGMSR